MSSDIIISSITGVLEVAGTAPASAVQSNENVQLETANQPGSSAIENRQLNVQLQNADPDGQTIGRKIKKSRAEFDRAMRSFTRYYMAECGDNPPGRQLEADDFSLASKFVETVIYEVDPNPGQVKLAGQSGLSQSTWSRAFRRRTFWEEVDKRIDALWNVHRLVQDNIVRIEYEQEVAMRKGIDGKDNKDKNTGPNVEEAKAIARIDRKRRGKMDKEQMIRLIKKRKPSVKTEELEELAVSQLLDAIALLDP